MRTTLIIKDELLTEAKKRAADSNSSISAVVNEALAQAFQSRQAEAADPAFQMPTFQPVGNSKVYSTPSDFHDLEAAEDMKPYGK